MKTSLITAAIALITLTLLPSCTLTVDPDGTRNWSVSGAEVAKGILIYADK